MGKYKLDQYKETIIDLYCNDKLSCKEISAKINCSLCGVYDALKRWGIQIRNLSESHKIYTVDENYFKVIDNELKAYWLGFLYADGYITSHYKVGLALGIKDYDHLEKFNISIQSNHPINRYVSKSSFGNSDYCRVIISSETLYADLVNKGLVRNKSLILKFPTPEIVPIQLQRHFIRGYFDGDGSLILSNNSINFKICGIKEFLTSIIRIFNEVSMNNFKYNLFKRHKDEKNNYYISFGGSLKILPIFQYMYDESSIFLDRKYYKYLKLLEHIDSSMH